MIRSIFFWLLYQLRIPGLLQRRHAANGKFPILVFHRVTPHHDPFWQPLTVEAFEKIVELLQKHYRILPLENIFTYTQSELRNACFITFDDGFEDNFIWARPILIKHKVQASFFVPSDCIERKRIIWQMQIRNSIFFTEKKKITFEVGEVVQYDLTNLKQKISAYRDLIDRLSKMYGRACEQALESIYAQLGIFDDEHIAAMSVEQLQIIGQDFRIHSHTRTHLFLSMLDHEDLVKELKASRDTLQNWMNQKNPMFLAYPTGDYNEHVMKIAAGYYDGAFRVGDQLADAAMLSSDHYRWRIPRINMHMQSPHEVYALINGVHTLLRSLNFFKTTTRPIP